jgi:hypothetical protein
MLNLLRDLGDVEVVDRDYGVVELLMDLPAEGGGEAPRYAVRAAASGDLKVESTHSRGGGPATSAIPSSVIGYGSSYSAEHAIEVAAEAERLLESLPAEHTR